MGNTNTFLFLVLQYGLFMSQRLFSLDLIILEALKILPMTIVRRTVVKI